MIAEAFGVTATTPEELVEIVAAYLKVDKTCMKILTIAEVEKINKTAGEYPKRLRIF